MTLRRTLQLVAVLAAVGIGASGYLTYVYTMGGVPICMGGDGCSTVQTSPYAWVGPVPVPLLGLGAYLSILGAAQWALWTNRRREPALLALFALALVGVLYSAWLTYLELFVIYAICLWCVVSAVAMVLIFLLAVRAYNLHGREPR